MKFSSFSVLVILIGAGLSACSFGLHKTVSAQSIPVSTNTSGPNVIDSMVAPYKIIVDKEMNQVVFEAEVNFIANRPNGNLGNVVADIMLSESATYLPRNEKNVICILNHGGLRSSFSKGQVNLGDIFKVLPFDNQLVLVKMPAKSMSEIVSWLIAAGGHPISGFVLRSGEVFYPDQQKWDGGDFWMLTSDYLMNGGDYATFFKDKLEVKYTGLLIRDVFTNYMTRTKFLKDNTEERIKL